MILYMCFFIAYKIQEETFLAHWEVSIRKSRRPGYITADIELLLSPKKNPRECVHLTQINTGRI